MSDMTLLYVHKIEATRRGAIVCLRQVSGGWCVDIPVPIPAGILSKLEGRHVFVKGGWGDTCEIHSWPDMPTFEAVESHDERRFRKARSVICETCGEEIDLAKKTINDNGCCEVCAVKGGPANEHL